MDLNMTASLPSLVEAKYKAAKAAGALTFSETELELVKLRNGTNFQVRYCPALSKKPINNKPTKSDNETHPNEDTDSQTKKPSDPFEDPPEDLFVTTIPTQSSPDSASHIIVLNKYPIIAEHFILATKTNKAQTSMLEADDLAATYACLRAYESETGTADAGSEDADYGVRRRSPELFAFFNSGPHSGASQAHRHIQFLPTESMRKGSDAPSASSSVGRIGEEEWEPLLEMLLAPSSSLPSTTSSTSSDYKSELPLACFTRRFSEGRGPTTEELLSIYHDLYQAASNAVRSYINSRSSKGRTGNEDNDTINENNERGNDDDDDGDGEFQLHSTEGGSSPISYNLAMTMNGMGIVPRRREGSMLRVADETGAGEGGGEQHHGPRKGREVGFVALNGTLLAGTLMVKQAAEWDLLKRDPLQLDIVLKRIGIPPARASYSNL